jgi:peptide/nickel transport system ATP-binding protein
MPGTLLEIKDLEVVYRTDEETVRAVNGVSLALNRRETLGLVGETGAGKTSLALALLRLLPERTGRIAGGEIMFDGVDLLSLPEAEMRAIRGESIAMIFQDPMSSLNPVLTIGAQIAEAMEFHPEDGKNSRERINRRVDEMMELVGISPSRKNEYPHQFSGGMKQRVVIAMALACNPELLIADEPTTALDVTIQAQVLSLMKNLKDRLNTSVILITHDLGIVSRICDRVAVMYAGCIIETGTVRDLILGRRHHPYTDGLFGSIPDMKVRTRRLRPIEGLMPDPSLLPSGCSFHPRCAAAADICRQQKPALRQWGTHGLACHLFEGADR